MQRKIGEINKINEKTLSHCGVQCHGFLMLTEFYFAIYVKRTNEVKKMFKRMMKKTTLLSISLASTSTAGGHSKDIVDTAVAGSGSFEAFDFMLPPHGSIFQFYKNIYYLKSIIYVDALSHTLS